MQVRTAVKVMRKTVTSLLTGIIDHTASQPQSCQQPIMFVLLVCRRLDACVSRMCENEESEQSSSCEEQ